MSDIPIMPNPVNLTEVAAQMVIEAMEGEGLDKNTHALRVGITGGGCAGLQYLLDFTDSPNEEYDWIYDQHGIKIAVDQFSAMHLAGTTINYVDGLSGSGFKFENPSMNTRHCGCGSSFGYS